MIHLDISCKLDIAMTELGNVARASQPSLVIDTTCSSDCPRHGYDTPYNIHTTLALPSNHVNLTCIEVKKSFFVCIFIWELRNSRLS